MAPSELGFRLKCAREKAGLTQEEAARQSGINVKSISSFETGSRSASIKVSQLEALLEIYGLSVSQFFDPSFEAEIIEPPVHHSEVSPMRRTAYPVDPLSALTRRESDYPTPQSSLGGTATCPPPYRRRG